MSYWFLLFFFFQAEDGIRDIGVTGVQTCALPIWWARGARRARRRAPRRAPRRACDLRWGFQALPSRLSSRPRARGFSVGDWVLLRELRDLLLERGLLHRHERRVLLGGEHEHVRAHLRSEEHTSELQSRQYLVCRLLLEKKKNNHT